MNPFAYRHQLALRQLPERAMQLLQQVEAPPRLVAHLLLVHDVASQLIEHLEQQWPALVLDRDAVLFGAATHDLGKTIHRIELGEPGDQHERDGPGLLIQLGVSPRLARFAQTHSRWRTDQALNIEDLVVALADTCWKGKREHTLEQLVVTQIARSVTADYWTEWIQFDDIVERIAARGDERLAWQARFPP